MAVDLQRISVMLAMLLAMTFSFADLRVLAEGVPPARGPTPAPSGAAQAGQPGSFAALLASMSNEPLRDIGGEPVASAADIFTPPNQQPSVLIQLRAGSSAGQYLIVPLGLLQLRGSSWHLAMTAEQLQDTPKQPIVLRGDIPSVRLGRAPDGFTVFTFAPEPGQAVQSTSVPNISAVPNISSGAGLSITGVNPHERAQQTIEKLWAK